MPRPYQPSLLRLLHGLTALLVPLAWLTGLLVYSSYDARFGRLPFTLPGEWIDIHGTVGVLLWPLALLFGLYALTAGRARPRQPADAPWRSARELVRSDPPGVPVRTLTAAITDIAVAFNTWQGRERQH